MAYKQVLFGSGAREKILRGVGALADAVRVTLGILELVSAMRLSKPSTIQWCLALSGVSSVLVGLLLLGLPAAGVASVVRLLGLYAFVFGALILVAAFRIRAGGGAVPHFADR